MSIEIPSVIHKYDVADFTTYVYWQIYFQDAGSWLINGSPMAGTAGALFDINILTRPVNLSGGTGLYLLGDSCGCGPFYPGFSGDTSSNYRTPTRYYDGNFGNGRNDNSPSTPIR